MKIFIFPFCRRLLTKWQVSHSLNKAHTVSGFFETNTYKQNKQTNQVQLTRNQRIKLNLARLVFHFFSSTAVLAKRFQ